MSLDLSKFNIRKTNPKVYGNISLPENVERYIVKPQGLIGIDIFENDKIKIINTEGGQICEVSVFNNLGINNQSIINKKANGKAEFIKYILNKSYEKIFY